jgi:hypothetical protein
MREPAKTEEVNVFFAVCPFPLSLLVVFQALSDGYFGDGARILKFFVLK